MGAAFRVAPGKMIRKRMQSMKGMRQRQGEKQVVFVHGHGHGRAGGVRSAPRLVVGTVVVAAGLWIVVGGGGGCQNRAGLPCQDENDCNSGLLCNKPPGAGPSAYGVCEAGLHGKGEICTYSSECSSGLLCSTDRGQPSEDGWHGVCVVAPADLGVASGADLLRPADLSPTDDASGDM
jgi:hypothetical protein